MFRRLASVHLATHCRQPPTGAKPPSRGIKNAMKGLRESPPIHDELHNPGVTIDQTNLECPPRARTIGNRQIFSRISAGGRAFPQRISVALISERSQIAFADLHCYVIGLPDGQRHDGQRRVLSGPRRELRPVRDKQIGYVMGLPMLVDHPVPRIF